MSATLLVFDIEAPTLLALSPSMAKADKNNIPCGGPTFDHSKPSHAPSKIGNKIITWFKFDNYSMIHLLNWIGLLWNKCTHLN